MWKQSLQTENMMTSCRGNAQLGKPIFVVDVFFDLFFFPLLMRPRKILSRFAAPISNAALQGLRAEHKGTSKAKNDSQRTGALLCEQVTMSVLRQLEMCVASPDPATLL